MLRPLPLILASALVLTSCGTLRESRINPFNWFGRGTASPTAEAAGAEVNPLLPRRARVSLFRRPEAEQPYSGQLILDLRELRVDRRPGGAIIVATGVAERIGPFDVRLVPDEDASTDGTMVLDFRVLQSGPRGGPEAARTVTAALSLSDNDLAGIRAILVRSVTTTRTARR